jgi:sRNA-binding protein
MHEDIARLAELFPNCFRQPRQPLKIGIHNDIIARHPELRPNLIASALKTYTRSQGYLETLKAGAPRIDLEGNQVGTVTASDEEDAKRKRSADLAQLVDRSPNVRVTASIPEVHTQTNATRNQQGLRTAWRIFGPPYTIGTRRRS